MSLHSSCCLAENLCALVLVSSPRLWSVGNFVWEITLCWGYVHKICPKVWSA
jgi:hypothetical protein